MKIKYPLFILTTFLLFSCNNHDQPAEKETTVAPINTPTILNYTVVKVYPHDTASYTQGLIWHNNQLFEGTGLNGQSKLMLTDLTSGKALKKVDLSNSYFGEGITILNNKIYQLTWREHKVFVYDASTFKNEKEFDWTFEGWGLTTNGTQLIISTGGSNLYFVNPETFNIEKTVGVSDNNGYVGNLNELEWVDGKIYANVYMTNFIVQINANTGAVEGKIDFTDLLQKTNTPINENMDVLNGIAYDPSKKAFYITGKKWPAMFEIKLN